MGYPTIQLLADFGDSALVIPAALVLLGWFVLRGTRRLALAWGSTLVLCAVGTVGAKIAFEACGGIVPSLDIRSPSGHVAGAAMLYGALAVIVGVSGRRWRLAAALAAAAVLVAAVGYARVLQRVHAPEEATAGAMIGAASAAWFAAWYRREPAAGLRWRAAVAMTVLAVAAAHGMRINFEGQIIQVAKTVHWHFALCRDHDPSSRVRHGYIAPADGPPRPAAERAG